MKRKSLLGCVGLLAAVVFVAGIPDSAWARRCCRQARGCRSSCGYGMNNYGYGMNCGGCGSGFNNYSGYSMNTWSSGGCSTGGCSSGGCNAGAYYQNGTSYPVTNAMPAGTTGAAANPNAPAPPQPYSAGYAPQTYDANGRPVQQAAPAPGQQPAPAPNINQNNINRSTPPVPVETPAAQGSSETKTPSPAPQP